MGGGSAGAGGATTLNTGATLSGNRELGLARQSDALTPSRVHSSVNIAGGCDGSLARPVLDWRMVQSAGRAVFGPMVVEYLAGRGSAGERGRGYVGQRCAFM